MEDTDHPLTMANEDKTSQLIAMLLQQSSEDVKRATDPSATTLCKCDLLIGLPFTAPDAVCRCTYCSHQLL